MKRLVLFASAAAFAASPVFAGALQPSAVADQAATGGLVRIAMSMSEEYVTKASHSNMAEVGAGKLAEDKGTHAEVKAFGAMMVKEHTLAEAKLKSIVTADPSVKMPDTMLAPKDAATKTKLEAASGKEFDTLYIQAQIEGHTAALKLQQDYAKDGSDIKLRAYAMEMVPIVAGHLEHAKKLAGQMGAM